MVKNLLSKRLANVDEYYFSQKLKEIDVLNAKGRNILNLGIGNPDLSPPEEVSKILSSSLGVNGFHKYQSYKGLPELRQSFSAWYKKYFDTLLNPDEEILPLIGSKEGVMHTCMAFLNPGEKALVPNPGYPTYASAVKLAGGDTKNYALREENDYLPDFEELEKSDLHNVKMMWVNYPHMPTGKNGSLQLFDKLIAFCRNHEIILINDNPYGFILTESPKSILEKRRKGDLLLELNSLSKSHNMPGWRVGVLSGHPELIQAVLTFKSQMDSGMFKPIMQAAVVALGQEPCWYEGLNKIYRKRQKTVFEIAGSLGCSVDHRQVGMFVWAKIPEEAKSGRNFSNDLLTKYDLFVPPGIIFGSEGDRFIRFSLCNNSTVWNEGLSRIKRSNPV